MSVAHPARSGTFAGTSRPTSARPSAAVKGRVAGARDDSSEAQPASTSVMINRQSQRNGDADTRELMRSGYVSATSSFIGQLASSTVRFQPRYLRQIIL